MTSEERIEKKLDLVLDILTAALQNFNPVSLQLLSEVKAKL